MADIARGEALNHLECLAIIRTAVQIDALVALRIQHILSKEYRTVGRDTHALMPRLIALISTKNINHTPLGIENIGLTLRGDKQVSVA